MVSRGEGDKEKAIKRQSNRMRDRQKERERDGMKEMKKGD